MTKKHFEYAAELCRERGKAFGEADRELKIMVESYIALFRHFSFNFNEAVFRAACSAF